MFRKNLPLWNLGVKNSQQIAFLIILRRYFREWDKFKYFMKTYFGEMIDFRYFREIGKNLQKLILTKNNSLKAASKRAWLNIPKGVCI